VVAVDLVLLLFIPFRRIHGIGYRFRLGLGDARAVLVNFIFFAILAIPLGLGIGFLTFGSASFDLGGFLSSLLAIFVFTAVPEELLFRGLIQNLLDKRWGRGWPSLLVAAAIFGVAHLNNGDIPNWSYALMATLAGVFYGRAFRQSGFLTAPAVVHALVDAVWHAFFS
jgi:membrane protease YdiL (CAAX protease family)